MSRRGPRSPGESGVTPTTVAPQLSAWRRAVIDRSPERGRPIDADLLSLRVTRNDDGVEIELVRPERRVPVEVVRERLPQVLLDRRRQRDLLAQHLRWRQRDDQPRRGDGAAVGDIGQASIAARPACASPQDHP